MLLFQWCRHRPFSACWTKVTACNELLLVQSARNLHPISLRQAYKVKGPCWILIVSWHFFRHVVSYSCQHSVALIQHIFCHRALGEKKSPTKGYAKGISTYQMGMSSDNGVCHYHTHLNVMTFHTPCFWGRCSST